AGTRAARTTRTGRSRSSSDYTGRTAEGQSVFGPGGTVPLKRSVCGRLPMATDAASARYQEQPRPGAGDRPGGHAGGPADTQPVRYRWAETGDRAGYSAAVRAA